MENGLYYDISYSEINKTTAQQLHELCSIIDQNLPLVEKFDRFFLEKAKSPFNWKEDIAPKIFQQNQFDLLFECIHQKAKQVSTQVEAENRIDRRKQILVPFLDKISEVLHFESFLKYKEMTFEDFQSKFLVTIHDAINFNIDTYFKSCHKTIIEDNFEFRGPWLLVP